MELISHVEDALTIPVERNRVAPFIFYTQRHVGVVSGVTNASNYFFFLTVFDIDLRGMPINIHSY